MRVILLASAAAIGLAVPAAAQEAAPAADFTGPRVEGLIGYDVVQDGGDQDSSSSNGILYGAAIGYDVQAGPAVVGIEGEVLGSTTDTRTNDVLVAGDSVRLDAGRDLYAGVRAGYAVTPAALAYVKAGYTNAQFDARYRLGNTRIDDSAKLDGFRVGAGLEHRFGVNSYIKGEYRYSNYGDTDAGTGGDVDRHQLVAGFGLRF